VEEGSLTKRVEAVRRGMTEEVDEYADALLACLGLSAVSCRDLR
jgi:hypothetical protein